MDATDIAKLIRHERKRQGLTLEDLAEKVGLTAGALSHIENGRRLPAPENAVAIARALGFDEHLALAALDEAHRERRYDALSSVKGSKGRTPSTPDSAASDEPRWYRKRDVTELFEVGSHSMGAPPVARLSASGSSMRDTARWSENTAERLEALEQLADTASRSIRTLRGLLEDEDPAVRREARRLLRELDVRLPDETSGA